MTQISWKHEYRINLWTAVIKMDKILSQIVTVIRTSLVPFLLEKMGNDISEDTIQGYVSEWMGGSSPTKVVRSKAKEAVNLSNLTEAEMEDVKASEYGNLTASKLKALCNDRSLAKTGTKAALIERLKMSDKRPASSSDEVAEPIASTSRDDDKPRKRMAKSRSEKKSKKPTVIEKIAPDDIVTEIDEYGNVVHVETGFVFNDSNEVCGKVSKDGTLLTLSNSDIDVVKDMGLNYHISYLQDSDED